VPEDASFQPKPRTGPDLTEFMTQAAAFYKEQLKGSERAINYLKKRGLTGQIAARFGLGYAPAQSTALKQVFPNYDAPELAAAGLVIDNERGRYDRFRDRIMFPIRNAKGLVIAFGGRILDQGEPKYLNSPETPIFHKGSEVYGLFEGRQAIREAGKILVVEGYMDVVALAQFDINYAVATLGTATTPIHARTLLRQTDKLYYCFDGDNAGRKAAWRALENTLETLADGKEVFFLFLPEGEDPDTWVRTNGKETFEQFMQREAVPLSRFLIRELSREADLSSQEGRAKLLKNATPLLQKIAAPLLASLIRRQLGDTLGMGGDEIGSLTGAKRTFSAKSGRPAIARARPSLCRTLARALIARPEFAPRIELGKLPTDDPHSNLLAGLVEWLNSFETPPSPAAMLEDPGAQSLPELGELQGEAEMLEQKGNWDPEAELLGGIGQINALWARQRRETLAKRFGDLSEAEREELLSLGKT
jgi:DNA primase